MLLYNCFKIVRVLQATVHLKTHMIVFQRDKINKYIELIFSMDHKILYKILYMLVCEINS